MECETMNLWSGQIPNTKVQSQSWDSESRTQDPKKEIWNPRFKTLKVESETSNNHMNYPRKYYKTRIM